MLACLREIFFPLVETSFMRQACIPNVCPFLIQNQEKKKKIVNAIISCLRKTGICMAKFPSELRPLIAAQKRSVIRLVVINTGIKSIES